MLRVRELMTAKLLTEQLPEVDIYTKTLGIRDHRYFQSEAGE